MRMLKIREQLVILDEVGLRSRDSWSDLAKDCLCHERRIFGSRKPGASACRTLTSCVGEREGNRAFQRWWRGLRDG